MTFLKACQDRVKSHFGIEIFMDMKNLLICSIPPLHKHTASSNSSLTSKDILLTIPPDIVKLAVNICLGVNQDVREDPELDNFALSSGLKPCPVPTTIQEL